MGPQRQHWGRLTAYILAWHNIWLRTFVTSYQSVARAVLWLTAAGLIKPPFRPSLQQPLPSHRLFRIPLLAMFTIKATYHGHTRKHTFSDTHGFPTYDQICHQVSLKALKPLYAMTTE